MGEFFFRKKNKGFSLIELMIVMAIITIMTTISLVFLGQGRSNSRLKAAQAEVTATIRLAQGYALQGKTQNGQTPCGYGFRFSGGAGNEIDYEIFYNTPVSGGVATCDMLNSNASGRQHISPGSVQAESYQLKDPVRRGTGSPSSYEIYFTVPHAKIYDTNGAELTTGSIGVAVRIPGGSTKSVTLYPGGRIVEDP